MIDFEDNLHPRPYHIPYFSFPATAASSFHGGGEGVGFWIIDQQISLLSQWCFFLEKISSDMTYLVTIAEAEPELRYQAGGVSRCFFLDWRSRMSPHAGRPCSRIQRESPKRLRCFPRYLFLFCKWSLFLSLGLFSQSMRESIRSYMHLELTKLRDRLSTPSLSMIVIGR